MSRPASCSALSGSKPLTGSVVDFWKNSGTISTRPPTSNTSKIKTIIRKLLVSTFSCDRPPLALLFAMIFPYSGVGASHGSRNGHGNRAAAGRRLECVPEHDQHATEVQETAQQAQHIKRKSRFDRFHKGVGQGSIGVDSAPHQTLHHAGNPHGSDVDHDTNGCRPEMHFNRFHAVHLLLTKQARDQVVHAAHGHQTDPTRRTP